MLTRHSDSEVAVMGAGVVGLSLGISLAQTGARVSVLEKSSLSEKRGFAADRVFVLTEATTNLLKQIGVWGDVAKNANPIDKILVGEKSIGSSADRPLLEFARREAPLVHVMRESDLQSALLNLARSTSSLSIFDSVTIDRIDTHREATQLSDAAGSTFVSKLVIGCDGRASMAATLAGIPSLDWNFNQFAVVMMLDHEPVDPSIALQVLLPDGPASILPLSETKSSIMWTLKASQKAQMARHATAAISDHIAKQLAPYLGDVKIASTPALFPMVSSVRRRFVRKRLALVGDAAHVFHPVTGQGLNYGFRDIAALTKLISEARALHQDLGNDRLLRKYQRARRLDAFTMCFVTNGIVHLFSNQSTILGAARSLGGQTLGSMPWFRDFLIQRANGPVSHDLTGFKEGV